MAKESRRDKPGTGTKRRRTKTRRIGSRREEATAQDQKRQAKGRSDARNDGTKSALPAEPRTPDGSGSDTLPSAGPGTESPSGRAARPNLRLVFSAEDAPTPAEAALPSPDRGPSGRSRHPGRRAAPGLAGAVAGAVAGLVDAEGRLRAPAGPPAPWAALDVETDGLDPGRVQEVGVVLVHPEQGVRRFAFCLLEEDGSTPDCSEDAAFALTPEEGWAYLEGKIFCQAFFLAAHQAGYEAQALRTWAARVGSKAPELPFLCTLRLAQRLWKAPTDSLEDICRFLGIPHPRPHAALPDADAAAAITALAWRLQSGYCRGDFLRPTRKHIPAALLARRKARDRGSRQLWKVRGTHDPST